MDGRIDVIGIVTRVLDAEGCAIPDTHGMGASAVRVARRVTLARATQSISGSDADALNAESHSTNLSIKKSEREKRNQGTLGMKAFAQYVAQHFVTCYGHSLTCRL